MATTQQDVTPSTTTLGPAVDPVARGFSISMVVSGIRCTLAYVVFPWVLPILGLTGAVGPIIGIVVSLVAIGFNVASIRRFWRADHRWKWPVTALSTGIIGLLLVLLVRDVLELIG
jgi:heme O synthase-like polyprenyltransferase